MGLRSELDAQSRAKKMFLDYFVYVMTWNPLAANAVTPVAVPLTSDSDFVLDGVSLVAYTGVGVLLPNPDYLLQLIDTGSGRNLQDAPVHVNNIAGQGNLLYILPEPKLFKGGATITGILTNNTAVAARVDIALIGRKIFYLGGYNRETVFAGYF